MKYLLAAPLVLMFTVLVALAAGCCAIAVLAWRR